MYSLDCANPYRHQNIGTITDMTTNIIWLLQCYTQILPVSEESTESRRCATTFWVQCSIGSVYRKSYSDKRACQNTSAVKLQAFVICAKSCKITRSSGQIKIPTAGHPDKWPKNKVTGRIATSSMQMHGHKVQKFVISVISGGNDVKLVQFKITFSNIRHYIQLSQYHIQLS